MRNSLGIAVRVFVVAFVTLGLVYPLAITGIAQLLWPRTASGSLVMQRQGEVVGSALIGQRFEGAGYFHPRASAGGYDALASGGTNLGPTSARLASVVAGRSREASETHGPIPADVLTASGSGLDPDISPGNALSQVTRVAGARGVDAHEIEAMTRTSIVGPDLGFIGEPRVNVLLLNLKLDSAYGRPRGGE